MVLDIVPAAWEGKSYESPIKVFQVTALPANVEITIKKRQYQNTWEVCRGGKGSEIVCEGEYNSADDALEALRQEFPA